jgi:hypothetical protein
MLLTRTVTSEVIELNSGDKIYCEHWSLMTVHIKSLVKKYNSCQTYLVNEPATDASSFYCANCEKVFVLIRFLERNYDVLRTNPKLLNVYCHALKEINLMIRDIELSIVKCNCWQYYSWRVTEGSCMLTPEYKYYQRKYGHISKKQLPASAFNNRNLYRLQCNNFMFPTDELDSDDEYVKKHDYNLIMDELKFWRERFSQEPASITTSKKHAKLQLDKNIDNDCISKVFDFVW